MDEYVKWLNKVYDRLFEEDITVQNEISRLFENGYNKYDETVKKLNGIIKSPDNYDLRDISDTKNDYLLYDDYINGKIDYENTISLPYFFEKKYRHEIPQSRKDVFYNVLKLRYTFEEGIYIEKGIDLFLC